MMEVEQHGPGKLPGIPPLPPPMLSRPLSNDDRGNSDIYKSSVPNYFNNC